MRFMVMVKATQDSEAGVMPDEKLLADMGRFNEELVKAGVLLAGEGLQPTSKGARVRFSGVEADRHRRAVRRDQGADRRVLAVAGEVEGRGDRMGEALPEPVPGRVRDRDPPGVRGRGLRRRVHAGAARAGGAPARRGRQARERGDPVTAIGPAAIAVVRALRHISDDRRAPRLISPTEDFMLKKLAIAVAAIVAAFLIYAATQPDTFQRAAHDEHQGPAGEGVRADRGLQPMARVVALGEARPGDEADDERRGKGQGRRLCVGRRQERRRGTHGDRRSGAAIEDRDPAGFPEAVRLPQHRGVHAGAQRATRRASRGRCRVPAPTSRS